MHSLANVSNFILGVLISIWILYVGLYVRFKHPEYTETQLFLYAVTFSTFDINVKDEVNE